MYIPLLYRIPTELLAYPYCLMCKLTEQGEKTKRTSRTLLGIKSQAQRTLSCAMVLTLIATESPGDTIQGSA